MTQLPNLLAAFASLFSIEARLARATRIWAGLAPPRLRIVGVLACGTRRRIPLSTTKREVAEMKRDIHRSRKRQIRALKRRRVAMGLPARLPSRSAS